MCRIPEECNAIRVSVVSFKCEPVLVHLREDRSLRAFDS